MNTLPADIRQSLDAVRAAQETRGSLPAGHLAFIEDVLERCLELATEEPEAA